MMLAFLPATRLRIGQHTLQPSCADGGLVYDKCTDPTSWYSQYGTAWYLYRMCSKWLHTFRRCPAFHSVLWGLRTARCCSLNLFSTPSTPVVFLPSTAFLNNIYSTLFMRTIPHIVGSESRDTVILSYGILWIQFVDRSRLQLHGFPRPLTSTCVLNQLILAPRATYNITPTHTPKQSWREVYAKQCRCTHMHPNTFDHLQHENAYQVRSYAVSP